MRLSGLAPWLALASLVAACGPSYQALYEGDARFEHCYALEESGAPMTQKSTCWRDWMLRYTYGQTRDRKEYAAARYRALTRANAAPTDEAMMEAAPNAGRDSNVAAPAPTSAFAPPPKTMSEFDAGAPTGELPGYEDAGVATAAPFNAFAPAQSAPDAHPPGASCADKCTSSWNDCKGACSAKGCDACAATYKKCMRGCFK